MKILKPNKMRADQMLVNLKLAETRSKAAAYILSGNVYCGEKRIEKPGDLLPFDAALTIREKNPFVSRGGYKLSHALTHFNLSPKDKIGLDIGASTGGFTDVLLQNGALKVYAVDVGQGQLDWKLRQDTRIINLENKNARYLTEADIPEQVDCIVTDASFISLDKVLEKPMQFAKDGAWLIALIKPQFEVGKGQVGKGGIVRDPLLHEEVCLKVQNWLISKDWVVLGITESPILGTKGNKEFLIAAINNEKND